MKKITIQNLFITGVILVVFALLAAWLVNVKDQVPLETQNDYPTTYSATITIEGLFVDKDVTFSSAQTVLEVLEYLDSEYEEVQLKVQEYPGLGVLVESMGGKTNGDSNEWWQYTVNEVMPQVGADSLLVESGDSIEWYFDSSQF